jgi:hypothetical protein
MHYFLQGLVHIWVKISPKGLSPVGISHIDKILPKQVRNFGTRINRKQYTLEFRQFGRSATSRFSLVGDDLPSRRRWWRKTRFFEKF